MKKIKILQVTGVMNRGGAEVMLMDIFRNISSEFEFHFLINYKVKQGIVKGDFDDEIIKLGGTIHYIGAQWDIGPIKYLQQFSKICKQIGTPNAVHIHMNAKSGIIALAAKLAGIKKIIVHSHANLKVRGSWGYKIASTLEWYFQKIAIMLFANQFWACSQEAMDSLFFKRIQKKGQSYIINNAVDVAKFQNVSTTAKELLKQTYKGTKETLIIGNIGRIVQHKNVDFIIEILNALEKNNIQYKFVFAGRADDQLYLDTIFKKATDYNLLQNVIYLGNREDVAEVVNTFDVFLGTALKEGFGLVAVEAQAAGVPCILYKGFPKSVDMNLNLVTFLDDFNVLNWVSAIENLKPTIKNQQNIKNQINALGFDIVENTKKIEHLYKS